VKIRLTLLLMGLGLAALFQDRTTAQGQTPQDLDKLLAPIALYPDPLIALILPASTAPSDVTLAARYLEANGDPAQIENQSWDDSVKALAHYPDVVKWMDANLEWTQALGAAFVRQPADVMKSVQRLRAQARAAGTLVDTPQQDVVMEDDNIAIVPAQPDVIYVPEYDPEVVYVERGPPLVFDGGWPVGVWLGFECDWDDGGIRCGEWHRDWDWRRRHFAGDAGRPWRPDPRRVREQPRDFDWGRRSIPAPRPMPGVFSGPPRGGGIFVPVAGNSRTDIRRGDPAPRPPPVQRWPAAAAPQKERPGSNGRGGFMPDPNDHGRQKGPPIKMMPGRLGAPSTPPPQYSASPDKDKDKDKPPH
jgi:hypothetical protein